MDERRSSLGLATSNTPPVTKRELSELKHRSSDSEADKRRMRQNSEDDSEASDIKLPRMSLDEKWSPPNTTKHSPRAGAALSVPRPRCRGKVPRGITRVPSVRRRALEPAAAAAATAEGQPEMKAEEPSSEAAAPSEEAQEHARQQLRITLLEVRRR